jgi:hypothetical protein
MTLPHDRLDDDPGENGHRDIGREYKRDEQKPTQFGPLRRKLVSPSGPVWQTIAVSARCHIIPQGQVGGHGISFVAFEMQSDKGKKGARVSAFDSFVTTLKVFVTSY